MRRKARRWKRILLSSLFSVLFPAFEIRAFEIRDHRSADTTVDRVDVVPAGTGSGVPFFGFLPPGSGVGGVAVEVESSGGAVEVEPSAELEVLSTTTRTTGGSSSSTQEERSSSQDAQTTSGTRIDRKQETQKAQKSRPTESLPSIPAINLPARPRHAYEPILNLKPVEADERQVVMPDTMSVGGRRGGHAFAAAACWRWRPMAM